MLIFWALSWNQNLAKNNFGEEKLGIKVWNKDSQVSEGVLQEKELEQGEFGVNSCIITDDEDLDGLCDGQTSWLLSGGCAASNTHPVLEAVNLCMGNKEL